MGGGSAHSIDGFSGYIDLSNGKKGIVLSIRQSKKTRLSIGRNIDDNADENKYGDVFVYRLTFSQAFRKSLRIVWSSKTKATGYLLTF